MAPVGAGAPLAGRWGARARGRVLRCVSHIGLALTRPARRPRPQVEAKKAVPKDDQQPGSPPSERSVKTKKIFVGGLAPGVDEKVLRDYFEQFGAVDDAVVMYDHDNKRPRGFGFVTFAVEESVDKVFARGVMQAILEKQIEIKAAVPRDQMPPASRGGPGFYERGPPPFGGPPPGPRYPYAAQPAAYAGYGGRGGPYGRGFVPTAAPGGRQGRFGGPPGGLGGPPAHFGGPGGMRGGYGPMPGAMPGKVMPPGGYDAALAYGGMANGMFGGNSALYANLGFNGSMQGPAAAAAAAAAAGAVSSKLNHLKALGALAGFGAAFPGGQGEGGGYAGGDGTAAAGAYAGDGTDFAAEAVNTLNAASAAAAGLTMAADFNSFHDAGFTASPAPGWSS
jgi:hypothetical protein